MKIVADADLPFVKEYFAPQGELILKPGRLLTPADVHDADVLLVRSVTRVDENLLRHSAVKFVGTVTAGIDHVDTVWLAQAGIQWCSAAGYNALAVADYVMAVTAAAFTAQEDGYLPRVAVVGVGQVGSRVAERFKKLGFKVLVVDPPRAAAEKEFPATSLAKLGAVDLLTVHTPLTRSGPYPTYHLIDQAILAACRGKSILINTARGAVVDSNAIKNSREQWKYCVDVWENEPEIDRAVLHSAFIATPHLAGHSLQTRYRGIQSIYQAFCETYGMRPQILSLPTPPRQTLTFGGRHLRWQEVVLAIFNPLSVTQEMKALLLKAPQKCETLFDGLRQQYIGNTMQRYEFAFTSIADLRLQEEDREILTQFGINIKE
jgi:erythronate-4-phosphate dehydrogenase